MDALPEPLTGYYGLLFAFLLLAIGVLVVYTNYRSSGLHRPPRLPYWIPWLGSAIEIGKDPDTFFERTIQKLGPVFRLKTVGRDMIYVASPTLIQSIFRDTKHYDFAEIRLQMNAIFLIPKYALPPDMVAHYFPAHHRVLAPNSVPDMLKHYTRQAHHFVTEAIASHSGRKIPLADFIVPAAYNATAKALFGHSFPADKTFDGFKRFDAAFPLMVADAPGFMFAKARRAWANVIDVLESYVEELERTEDIDVPPLARLTLDTKQQAGWDAGIAASVMAGDLWASQANGLWAAYWVLVFMLLEPHGLAPLVAEIDRARASWTSSHADKSLDAETFHEFMMDSVKALPLLTSAVQESLRISSSVMPIRRVVEPVELGGYQLQKDDTVLCVTRSVHLDDEIHPDAASFRMDRYCEGQKFTKDGKPVPNHSMPFGGGVSICEGRHFVMGELKALIALILTYATVELADESVVRPQFDWSRLGSGIMQPRGDINVVIGKRKFTTS
ncbi:cytochrome P450 [Obba rivulosa]|uniref:Cytochrome P450 n=1 Tax=Obba rivulosa TaxID=1052685 RepID=A0A8E2AJC0_9APHY|nr:cytochrome P450 [Obba rivulosa]